MSTRQRRVVAENTEDEHAAGRVRFDPGGGEAAAQRASSPMIHSKSNPGRRAALRAMAVAPLLGVLPELAWPAPGETDIAREPLDPFQLIDVRLLPGPFRTAQELDARYMRSLD